MARTWSSKRLALLGLVLLVHQSACGAVDSLDFSALTPAPTSRVPRLTMAPSATATPAPKTTPKKTPKPSTTTTARPTATTARPAATAKPSATTARPSATTSKPTPTTAKPSATTKKPTPTTAKPSATLTKTKSPTTAAIAVLPASPPSTEASSSSDSGSKDAVVPSPSPSVTTAAPAPASPYECSASNSALITNLYEKNNVMQGDCAAVNDYYRFPFEGAPTRDQMIRMSKSSACTVLMQALLQLLAVECDFKGIAIRSTAEAIIQLSKEIKTGNAQELPSETAIIKAIRTRRSDLLNIPAGTSSSSSKAPGASTTSAASAAAAASSSSGWKIAGADTDETNADQHILMSKDLLIVGTWSDAIDASSGNGRVRSGSHHGSKAGNVTVDAASSSAAPVNLVHAVNVAAVLLVSTMMMML